MEVMRNLITFSRAEDQSVSSSVVFLQEELRETDRALAVYEYHDKKLNAVDFVKNANAGVVDYFNLDLNNDEITVRGAINVLEMQSFHTTKQMQEEVIDGFLDCMFVCLSGIRKAMFSNWRFSDIATDFQELSILTKVYKEALGTMRYCCNDNGQRALEVCFGVIFKKQDLEMFFDCLRYSCAGLHSFLGELFWDWKEFDKDVTDKFIAEAFERVCDANLAKLDPETGKFMKDENGKIKKPDSWQPPQYADLIKKYSNNE